MELYTDVLGVDIVNLPIAIQILTVQVIKSIDLKLTVQVEECG